jgi:hypothetical protein
MQPPSTTSTQQCTYQLELHIKLQDDITSAMSLFLDTSIEAKQTLHLSSNNGINT